MDCKILFKNRRAIESSVVLIILANLNSIENYLEKILEGKNVKPRTISSFVTDGVKETILKFFANKKLLKTKKII